MARRSKKTRGKMSSRIQGIPNGFPPTRTAHLIYNDVIQFTSSTGLLNSHLFRCNSIYDPDYTGTGHQPFLSDTWAGMYNHVTVKGARIKVRWMNGAGETAIDVPAYVGVYLGDGTTVPYSSASTFIESQKGDVKLIKSDGSYPTTSCNFSLKKFYNIDDVKDNYYRFGHSTSTPTPPSDVAYFIVWLQAVGSHTATLTADITISYIVEYSEPRDVASS